MAQRLVADETGDMEEELVVEEKITSVVPGSRLMLTAMTGVVMVAIGVFAVAVNGTWSKRAWANPGASIMKQATQIDQCFEENVAYKLGKVRKGKSEWILEDEKKNSPHECQIWCQTVIGCQFFTFKQRTSRCILTTARGEKLKKGQKAISGPRVCPGVAQPCQEYLPSTVWTLNTQATPAKQPGKFEKKVFEYTGQLSGRGVKLEVGYVENAWPVPNKAPDQFKQLPTWPKAMPTNFQTVYRPPNFVNITFDGDPIEDLVVTWASHLYQKQWKLMTSEAWSPVTDSLGFFRSDYSADGRTLVLEEGTMEAPFVVNRVLKPVSKFSITTNVEELGVDGGGAEVMIYQGKNC